MSKIEWTDKTWNPIIGCSKISDGCQNCYAEIMAGRLANMQNNIENYGNVIKWQHDIDEPHEVKALPKWNGQTIFCENMIKKPFHWKKPQKIFICSMGDLFHESIPFEWINAVFMVMSDNDQHIYQILTKRPKRVLDFISWKWEEIRKLSPDNDYIPWQPKDNIWFGATIENEKEKHRILDLLKIPAKIHFISCEPLLSNIDLYPWLEQYIGPSESGHNDWLKGLDWVIAGGESGPHARPTHPDWIRSIQYQCQMANIPFFFKQWGTNRPFEQTAQPPFYRDVCTGKEFDSHGMNFIDPYTSEMGRFRGHQWLDWPFIDDCMFLKIHNHKKYTDYNMIDGKRYLEFPKIDLTK